METTILSVDRDGQPVEVMQPCPDCVAQVLLPEVSPSISAEWTLQFHVQPTLDQAQINGVITHISRNPRAPPFLS